MLRIRKLGDPVLITPTKSFELFNSDSASRLVDGMFDIMYNHNGVGLAANQIGLSQSLFVYDDREGHKGVVCNPHWDPYMVSDGQREEEGCLSIPGVHREVSRHNWIWLYGQNLKGDKISILATGLLSRIFQHETDHLNGKLYISYLSKEEQMAIVMANQVL